MSEFIEEKNFDISDDDSLWPEPELYPFDENRNTEINYISCENTEEISEDEFDNISCDQIICTEEDEFDDFETNNDDKYNESSNSDDLLSDSIDSINDSINETDYEEEEQKLKWVNTIQVT